MLLSLTSKLKFPQPKGFTLIELMIVFSVTAILGVFSVAAFWSYGRSQELANAANDVTTLINKAKSRAQSQFKPEGCTGALEGYQVAITSASAYELKVKCPGEATVNPIETKSLGSDVHFCTASGTAPDTTFLFRILSGGIANSGAPMRLKMSGISKSKDITVTAGGVIQITENSSVCS